MKLSKINKPKILLIGAGNFGKHHLDTWLALEKKGVVFLKGVVTIQNKERKQIKKLGLTAYPKLTNSLLEDIDAVDIVSPASTHYQLAKRCLPFTHVFLEKPITLSVAEGKKLHYFAKKYHRILFLGHIYRFHPLINIARKMISQSSRLPFFVECIFGDKPAQVASDCGVLFSDLHGFDIIDYLLNKEPKKIMTCGTCSRKDSNFEDDVAVVLEYGSNLRALVKLHWTGSPKTRLIILHFVDKIVTLNLIKGCLTSSTTQGIKTTKIAISANRPLLSELCHFVKVLQGKTVDFPDAIIGTRIINISANAVNSLRSGQVVKYQKI